MSEKLNISPFEEELKNQFANLEVPAPDGVWSGMEEQLDQLNQDLQFDQQIKQDLGQAQINPPSSVWQGVQGGLGSGTAGIGASVVGKWVLGVLVAGSVTYGTYALLSEDESEKDSAAKNTTEQVDAAMAGSNQEKPDNSTIDVDQSVDKDSDSRSTNQANLSSSTESQSPESNGSVTPVPTNSSTGKTGDGNVDGQPFEQDKPGTETPNGSGQNDGTNGSADKAEPVQSERTTPSLLLFSQARDTGVCAGSSIYYGVQGGNFSEVQVLANGELIKKIKPNQAIKFELEPGQYQVEFRAMLGENFFSTRRFIKVHELPKMAFVHDNTGEGMYQFRKTSGNAMQFAWFVDGAYASRNNEMEYRFFDQVPTEHRISLHGVNGYGCRDSVVQQIRNTHTVKVGIADPIPNIFTPNGDGVNDVYIIPADGVTSWNLVILDRAGRIVFQTTDPAKFWDGTNMFNGQTCGEGLYSYQLRYSLAGGDVQKASGTISLKREQ